VIPEDVEATGGDGPSKDLPGWDKRLGLSVDIKLRSIAEADFITCVRLISWNLYKDKSQVKFQGKVK
jgi:hypothetical protein